MQDHKGCRLTREASCCTSTQRHDMTAHSIVACIPLVHTMSQHPAHHLLVLVNSPGLHPLSLGSLDVPSTAARTKVATSSSRSPCTHRAMSERAPRPPTPTCLQLARSIRAPLGRVLGGCWGQARHPPAAPCRLLQLPARTQHEWAQPAHPAAPSNDPPAPPRDGLSAALLI